MRLAAILMLAAPACAAPGDSGRLANLLAGTWDNEAQFAAAPAAVRVAPTVGGRWLDRQVARFYPVQASQLGGRVLYVEWRGADGAITRQRIWRLRDGPDGAGSVAMDYYLIDRPERFAGRGREPGAFAALIAAELTGYGPGCAVRWTAAASGWRGRVEPDKCAITARSGRRMTLDVTVAATRDTLEYRERGVLENGAVAFDVPSFAPYAFRRVTRLR